MIDEATYGELDRYFHSQMNAEERGAFESRMNANEELRAEIMWLNTMLGGMKQTGRSVMKQNIANAIAGVPSGSVSKYKPSLNGKSFLKKWWWAISVVVAVAVAVGVYKYATRHIIHEGDMFEGEQSPHEAIPLTDTACIDSLVKPISVPEDSTSPQRIEGEAHVKYGYDDGYVVPKAKTPAMDSANKYYTWANGQQVVGVELPIQGTRLENMKTSINKRSQPPYTYTLDQNLILHANYASTAGFQFQGSGDTIYMTDNSGAKFRLVPTKTEKPLTPLSVVK